MIAPGLPFDSYRSDCEPKSGLVQSPGVVIALSEIEPLSAPEPPAETAPPVLPAGGDRLLVTPLSSSSSGSSSPAPPTVDDLGSDVNISGRMISTKSVSVTSSLSVGVNLTAASPILTVGEPASILSLPSPWSPSPLSAASSTRAAPSLIPLRPTQSAWGSLPWELSVMVA